MPDYASLQRLAIHAFDAAEVAHEVARRCAETDGSAKRRLLRASSFGSEDPRRRSPESAPERASVRSGGRGLRHESSPSRLARSRERLIDDYWASVIVPFSLICAVGPCTLTDPVTVPDAP